MSPPDLVSMLGDVVKAAVRDALAENQAANAAIGTDRLGFTEAEAASSLGVARHVLADARRRGEIQAKKVGKRFIYSRPALVRYLESAGD